MKELNGLATPKQCWALFCLTKKDYRKSGLSRQEAHDLIQSLIAEKDQPERLPGLLYFQFAKRCRAAKLPTGVINMLICLTIIPRCPSRGMFLPVYVVLRAST